VGNKPELQRAHQSSTVSENENKEEMPEVKKGSWRAAMIFFDWFD